MYEDDKDADWPPKQYKNPNREDYEFFKRNERLQDRFNEQEIDGFLKLLNVKPATNWTDRAGYHHGLGVHAYYDEAQHIDPSYHMVTEAERIHVEKQEVQKFRDGMVIRF